jgi:DNA-binding response OmpR family regulator
MPPFFDCKETYLAMCMRILIVEDHEHTRHVLKRLLQRWGFDVASAPTLQNGLSFLEAGPLETNVR